MADQNSQYRDNKLARDFGDVLEQNLDQSAISDPLYTRLLQYRRQKNQQLSGLSESSNKQETWANIAQKMDNSHQTETTSRHSEARIFSISHRVKQFAAIAASLLVVCFAGLYYYLAQPILIKRTGAEIGHIVLADGSDVTLRPHSQLLKTGIWSLSDYQYKLVGEGYFQVVDQTSGEFSVQAGDGGIRVLGTNFNVSAWGNTTQVFLQEGKVMVEDITTNESVTLLPNETASVASGAKIHKESTAEETEYTDWMQQQLVFNNRPLEYVFSELEQQFNITILVDAETADTRLTGELSIENLNTALSDLALVLDGTFTKVDNETVTATGTDTAIDIYRFEFND